MKISIGRWLLTMSALIGTTYLITDVMNSTEPASVLGVEQKNRENTPGSTQAATPSTSNEPIHHVYTVSSKTDFQQSIVSTESKRPSGSVSTSNRRSGGDNIFKRLMLRIEALASRSQLSSEEMTQLEDLFGEQVARYPHLVDELILIYEDLPVGSTRDLLRTLLTLVASREIESHAMLRLSEQGGHNSGDWLWILSNVGSQSVESNSRLLAELSNLTRVEDLVAGITALQPSAKPNYQERQSVIGELSTYAAHTDEMVRSAAIEASGRWADSTTTSVFEVGLTDVSDVVRQTTLGTIYEHGIASAALKYNLIAIATNNKESFDSRMIAFNTLADYDLQDSERSALRRSYSKLLSQNAKAVN